MTPAVAGAPVSFGVFEMTPEGADVVQPDAMLRILADIGYDGVDLGPIGYFGEGAELGAALGRHALALAGGWVQLPLTDDDAFAAALPALERALAAFAAASGDAASDDAASGDVASGDAASDDAGPARRRPLPTLADDGSAVRRAAPGRGAEADPLPEDGWRRLVANAERAAAMVRAAGFEPTFHHHAGTYVESVSEIDRFLTETDIGLTLDVGHLALAGGDPLALLRTWAGRVNHLHLKDVDQAALSRVVAAGGGMPEVWSSGAFTALGRGDLDLVGVMDAVMHEGFDGWVVVEQDVLNGPDVSIAAFEHARAVDQRWNREFLRRWI